MPLFKKKRHKMPADFPQVFVNFNGTHEPIYLRIEQIQSVDQMDTKTVRICMNSGCFHMIDGAIEDIMDKIKNA
jgi:hypothetical protein